MQNSTIQSRIIRDFEYQRDESTLLETYKILKQKNIIKNFDSLKQFKAISEKLFNQLHKLV